MGSNLKAPPTVEKGPADFRNGRRRETKRSRKRAKSSAVVRFSATAVWIC